MVKGLAEVAEMMVALVPHYGEQGEMVRILLCDGSEFLQARSVGAALKELWRIYSLDWRAYRRVYGPMLNRSNLLPWPADMRRTFAPLKLREPLIKGDVAYGYVAMEWVEKVGLAEPKRGYKTYLVLKSGQRLEVYLGPEEVHSHLQAAAYASRLYWGKRI